MDKSTSMVWASNTSDEFTSDALNLMTHLFSSHEAF